MKIKFEVQLSVKDGTYLDGSKGPLYYCVIRKDGEHLHTRQTLNQERACLYALELLSEHFVDLDQMEYDKSEK